MNTSLTERQKSWLTLAALWTLLLVMAALRPLAVPDEGRYGEIGRWMLQSGDWLTPRLNGLPFFHKPPYVYWLEAMSLATFGINEFAVRLVPALHVALMTVALYLSARTLTSESTARRAAVMLGTSLAFLVGGQYVNHDMAVAAWIGVAIWCFAFAFMAGDRPNAMLARLGFVACAFGMLSKGMIGVALPGLVIFVWLLWTRQFKKVLYLPWVSGLALFAVIAVPWFVLAQQKHPELFNYMFIGQQFNRYTAVTYNNPQPVWFYLLALALLFFPWVFFALNQVRRETRQAGSAPLTKDAWRLCWAWVLAILGFFSIPNSKLVGYILPVLPALALLAALGWERVMGHRALAGKAFAGLCVLSIGIAVALMASVPSLTREGRTQDVAAVLACEARASDTVYVAGAYPYDLPFYAQTSRPMVVLADWPTVRAHAGDGWHRELFEGANFDIDAGKVLQSPEVLTAAGLVSGNWFVSRKVDQDLAKQPGWTLFFEGAGWVLYQSGAGLAAKSPEAAEQKGLPGCKNQGNK